MRTLRSDRGQGDSFVVAAMAGGVVLLLAAVVLLFSFLAGWGSVPVDKVGLHYTGGPIEGEKFVKVIEPGSGQKFLGLSDKLVKLPVTQRDYTAANSEEADGPVIVAPAKGGVEMQFEIGAYFTLNTDGPVVRRFYERVCIKFDCTSGDGWNEMLQVNFRRPIEQAIQQSIRGYSVDQLYAGQPGVADEEGNVDATTVLVRVQDEIAADLRENINRILGGEYFCGPTFDRNEPDVCPDFEFQITNAIPTSESVRNSFAANAASQQEVITATNEANAEVERAEGQRRAQEALNNLYSDPNYIAYLNALALQECARNNNCTIVHTADQGVNVNVANRPAG